MFHLLCFVCLALLVLLTGANSLSTPVGQLQSIAYPTLCLRASGDTNGARLDLAPCSHQEANQLWNIDVLPGYETGLVGPLIATMSGLCISVDYQHVTNGATVAMYPYMGQSNQNWTIINGRHDTWFQIAAEHSGKCLTVEAERRLMHQWKCDPLPHQIWRVVQGRVYGVDCTCELVEEIGRAHV